MNEIQKLQKLVESQALEFRDCGKGHIKISGHGSVVNYWPLSRKRTAHLEGGESIPNCSHWDAVKLCLNAGKPGLAPPKKRITKNPPQVDLKDTKTNPARICHLYNGKTPPWEYPTFIACESDNLRIQAYQILCEAELVDHIND